MAEEKIDTQYTNEITCPYCGEELGDSWEYGDNGEIDCGECEKEFYFNRDVDVTYCSSKLDK